jgi:MFS family permease
MLGMAVIGAGIGLSYAAMPSLIMAAVPGSQTASANGLNSLMRAIGTSLASAIIAAILARMTIHLGGTVIPSASGFRVGLLAGGGGALIAALVVLAIPRQRPAVPRQVDRAQSAAPAMATAVSVETMPAETMPAEDAAPSAG